MGGGIYHAKNNPKKAQMATLISETVGLGQEILPGTKRILHTSSIHPEDITILCTQQITTSKHAEQKLTELKEDRHIHDYSFNSPFLLLIGKLD